MALACPPCPRPSPPAPRPAHARRAGPSREIDGRILSVRMTKKGQTLLPLAPAAVYKDDMGKEEKEKAGKGGSCMDVHPLI